MRWSRRTKKKRLIFIAGIGGVLSLAIVLMLVAFQDTIVFFRAPTDIIDGKVAPGERFRLGGLVRQGTLVHEENQTVRFDVTDLNHEVHVIYTGLLPDLFREGQGVVAEGVLGAGGVFQATSVLAKHDETYMPREVADALKKQGRWQPGQAGGQ